MQSKQEEWLHDLRAPLQLMYSCAQLLEMEIEDETAKGHVRLLMSGAREMQRIVTEGMETIRSEKTRWVRSEVVSKTWETFVRCGLYAERRKIHLSFHSNTDRQEWMLDEEKYSRILMNLIGNALKYTPDGGEVRVEVRALGDAVEISVADNGCGIAPERIDRIFDRYETDFGNGCGLYIAKKFATQMNGTIGVASVPGKGSTFTLRLLAAENKMPLEKAFG